MRAWLYQSWSCGLFSVIHSVPHKECWMAFGWEPVRVKATSKLRLRTACSLNTVQAEKSLSLDFNRWLKRREKVWESILRGGWVKEIWPEYMTYLKKKRLLESMSLCPMNIHWLKNYIKNVLTHYKFLRVQLFQHLIGVWNQAIKCSQWNIVSKLIRIHVMCL